MRVDLFFRNALTLVVAAMLLPASATLAQTVTPPPAGTLRPYVFPAVEQFQLGNGLKVILVQKHTLPVVEGRLILDAGSMREPAAKNGLAALTGSLLSEGTGTMTGADIARAMDALGARYFTGANFNAALADVVALKTVFPQALTLAARTVTAPSFPVGEISRVKNQALAAYQQIHARTAGLAADAFVRAAFDSTAPFSRPANGTPSTIGPLTRDDVINWHRTMYAPSAATLLLVGDLTPAEARSIAQQAYGGWTASRAAIAPVENPIRASSGTRVILLDRPGSVQSSIILGQPGFRATDPEYLTMVALNHVLGGGFTNRINLNLREKHGYTYGAGSVLDLRPGSGAFRISSDVRTNATDSALVEAVSEYKRIAGEPVPPQELQGAVNNLVSGFPSGVQTVQGLTARIQQLIVWGLPVDFYATYRERLAAVTPEDVRTAAASRLTPNNLIVVVAGDLSKIEAPIRARNLGTVEVWD
ncbi:MAG TPA: pitrilysin family protein, partial [Gemmatimonadaceae bacterium]|nr:pitrilysin family protein [Gemmatimonadaceae bacterium]